MEQTSLKCSITEGMCTTHKDEAVCMHHCTKQVCGCKAYKSYLKKHNIVAQAADSDEEDQEEMDAQTDEDLSTGGEQDEAGQMEDKTDASLYCLSLIVLGQIWEGKGDSVVDAMQEIKPENVKARGMWILKHNGKIANFPMFPPIIKKTLANKIFQEILQKRLITTLR